jgi:hypothetical protein
MAILVLKNWEQFQHYKDRAPPWVKLHRDLLTSDSWMDGTDTSRLVQVACMLLAARYQNATPYKLSTFRKAAYLECRESEFERAIVHLRDHNFLEIQEVPSDRSIVGQSASDALAKCSPSRGEERREEENTSSPLNGHENPILQPEPVARVFEHWRVTHKHPKAVLDKKRIKLIQDALKQYTPESLCESISGYLKSSFHMGANKDKKVYDDIELMLRDARRIDAGREYAEGREATQWE